MPDSPAPPRLLLSEEGTPLGYNPLDVATVYVATFAPRTDVYSTWVVGPDPEHPRGWRPVREPLTPEVALAGLSRTGPSISAYMIAPGSCSHVAALDFDTDDGHQQALALARFMGGEGLPAYVETSRRGAHLWCVLDRVLPAVAIRQAIRGLLQGAGLPDDDPHIEIRPGSDTVDATWHEHVRDAVVGTGLGHALRLPLMPHPKTGRQGKMLFASGEPMPAKVSDMLLAVELAPADTLLSWAERWQRPPLASVPPSYRNPHDRLPDDDASASELLRTLWGALDAAPGKVISCPAKQFHTHGDVHKGCRVFPDDRRVMCHKPGCILNNDGKGRGTYELRKHAPRHGE